MNQKIRHILHLLMAVFVLLSSVGVRAHAMHCHDTTSVSLFVPPKACCDLSNKTISKESAMLAPSCCLVLSEELVFEYENTVPNILLTDFSFDLFVPQSLYTGPQEPFRLFIELEDQNLPPPIVRPVHRSLYQVFII